jgi:O-antigen/teichoic acid export membrane protein
MIKKIAYKIGLDRAIFFTILSKVLSIGAGVITIIVITRFLTPELQGYYFTFNSLIALQVFAELGLNFAIVQFSSHEMARLSWQADGTVKGNTEAKRRLQSLMFFSLAWFGAAALLMIAFLLPLGLYFFGQDRSNIFADGDIAISWTLLVLFTSVNLHISAIFSLLEGCGKVAEVAILRLWQSLLSTTLVWFVLYLGGELYALAASSFMMAIIGFLWLWKKYRIFFTDLITYNTDTLGISWRKEIWPFQWRIAVSWMSGYFVFQLFNPLIFKTQGPILAGQMGMSMHITAAMNAAAIAWISTKAPIYGQLVAGRKRKELDNLFVRGVIQSSLFLLLGTIFVWIILFYLHQVGSEYADRVLPMSLFSILLFICFANHIIFAQSFYLRAHKQDPFMWISVFAGSMTVVLAATLVPKFGVEGAVYSFAIPTLSVGLIGGSILFFIKRAKWSGQAEARQDPDVR